MHPYVYQLLIEKGWRRCGTYYYKPDLQKSCCKLWTHRQEVSKFAIKKDQKKVMRKIFKLGEEKAEEKCEVKGKIESIEKKQKKKVEKMCEEISSES